MMLKMQAGLRDAKVKEDKATETEKSLQKAIADLKGKLDATNTTVNVQLDTANKVVDMAAAELIEEVEKTQPVEQTKALFISVFGFIIPFISLSIIYFRVFSAARDNSIRY